ncbi:MAG TPA: cation:dicarboxylase symporter family transporter, partial [Thermoanaerobaculia bacterium]|nr:cation:dicarboxylase symporter family transporter [Thermoanaerobaculia bacterium]
MALPKVSLTTKIFIGLFLGIALGYLKPDWGLAVRPLSLLFLNLIKSIIAPLIFSTLVIGIAGTGDIRQVGRIGIKALVYFEIVTTFALVIGLAAVNITKPGVGVSLSGVHRAEDKGVLADRAKKLAAEATVAAKSAEAGQGTAKGAADARVAAEKAAAAADATAKGLTAPDPPAKAQTFGEIVAHLAPASILKAMAEGDVLQIVVFSVMFALAVTSIGDKAKAVVEWCESLASIMFRFTEFVMKFAPIGVGAAMANTVGHSGLGVLKNLGTLVGTLYGALIVFVMCVLLPVAV